MREAYQVMAVRTTARTMKRHCARLRFGVPSESRGTKQIRSWRDWTLRFVLVPGDGGCWFRRTDVWPAESSRSQEALEEHPQMAEFEEVATLLDVSGTQERREG